MGTTPEQARAQVAATRGRIDLTLDRLEARLREELDPRRRLRRDGPRLALGVGVVALVGTAYLMQKRRRKRQEPVVGDWIESMPEEWRLRLQELLSEAAEATDLGARRRPTSGSRSPAQAIALRVGKTVAPIVLNALAERLANRQAGEPR